MATEFHRSIVCEGPVDTVDTTVRAYRKLRLYSSKGHRLAYEDAKAKSPWEMRAPRLAQDMHGETDVIWSQLRNRRGQVSFGDIAVERLQRAHHGRKRRGEGCFGEIAVPDTCAPGRRLAVHWQSPRFYIF